MPFLTESMYQNLLSPKFRQESIHLTDYPVADESLVDKDLSADMEALLRLVSLGSAARNSVKIKVRQPLAKLTVRTTNEAEKRAAVRFADQICEELNIKEVCLQAQGEPALLQFKARVDAKKLGPVLGANLAPVQRGLEEMMAKNPDQVASKLQKHESFVFKCGAEDVMLEPSDIVVQWTAPEGFAGTADGDTQILLDTRITEDLMHEGLAREVIRYVQEIRKKSKLEPEDRIDLYLRHDSATLSQALQKHQDYIAAETLTTGWHSAPLTEAHESDVTIEGHKLHVQVKKASMATAKS